MRKQRAAAPVDADRAERCGDDNGEDQEGTLLKYCVYINEYYKRPAERCLYTIYCFILT